MKKLEPEDIHPGMTVHGRKSVEVIRIEIGEHQSPPAQIVVFKDLAPGSRAKEKRLRIDNFCNQYPYRKKKKNKY